MSGRVTDTDHGAKAMRERIAALAASTARVRVGILDDAPKREHDGADGGTTLLEVAAVHEFGAPSRGVPQRSFIRGTVDEKREQIASLQVAVLTRVVKGEITEQQGLDQIGAKVAGMIQTRISQGIAPALKQETIDRKGSSTPLIDTNQLRSGVTWKVDG